MKVRLRAFEQLKPYYVRRLRERNTCACKQHVEILELLHGWNNMRSAAKGMHGVNCACTCNVCEGGVHGVCAAHTSHFGGLTDMWMSVLCPMQEDGWHKLDCLMGQCGQCGVDMLINCPLELSGDSKSLMQWNCYQKVKGGKTKAGKEYLVLRLQYKYTVARQFLSYLTPRMTKFITHNFVTQWEAEQYRVCLATFPPSSVVSVVDFAENYSFAEWNEIQEMHFSSVQLTILVHVFYRWNEEYIQNPNSGASKLITEYHYYMSDDMNHDVLFVRHCFDLHWRNLRSRDLVYDQHIVWSDGCAAQFKSRKTMYQVAM